MKKVIQMLSMLAVVVLCYSCASDFIASGRAMGTSTTDDYIIELGKSHYGRQGRDYTDENPVTYSECVGHCNDICRLRSLPCPGEVRTLGPSPSRCYCGKVPVDVLDPSLTYLDNTSSANECSRLAFTSGYLRYNYNNGKCYAKTRYESVGTAMTKKECQEIVKEMAPKASAIYVAKTQQCYYAYKDDVFQLGF